MQQQRNYACGTNRATAPFAKAIIRLDRLQPPSLENNRATAPFAKVIFDLTGYNPLCLRNNRATAPFAKAINSA